MKTKKLFAAILGLAVISVGGLTFASDSCSTYYDGCNTCTVTNGKIACTKMACKATVKPYCIDGMDINTVVAQPSVVDQGVSSEKVDRIPPYQGNKTYKFDERDVKSINLKDGSLMKVNCDTTQILKALGFAGNTKMFSVGLEEGEFDYNFDMRNCSMRGSKRNYTWSNKSLSEKDALNKAKTFMQNKFFNNKVFSKYGEPVVTYKNSNGGAIAYKMEASSSIRPMSDIEIDTTDTGTLESEYVSFSILFPYLIDNKPVYNSYGNKAGISLEVNADGVSSVNAQLLPFKGAVRSSEKLTADDIISFVKRGGNSPYRGNESEVALQTPERVNVLFTIYRNNTNETYLSSGIRFSSKIKLDQRSAQPYEMIVSDYKLGNSNYGY